MMYLQTWDLKPVNVTKFVFQIRMKMTLIHLSLSPVPLYPYNPYQYIPISKNKWEK